MFQLIATNTVCTAIDILLYDVVQKVFVGLKNKSPRKTFAVVLLGDRDLALLFGVTNFVCFGVCCFLVCIHLRSQFWSKTCQGTISILS